ncbi:hypothetical protein VCUG_00050 [Vavraia culicis subsp. floridensis]|uniref:Uncharacterized protein n=1 Tax=Vavraia culicis (isolate floridensis) TaxID=948595 RepID=L2GXP8_VAVCU|nr:uncharacterized protein VCUG_00050 [Vavraia culicis subsp. floridensis]ELA48441.1 hypothetical protein VCUG_00050 [Vavraia culicis subsp. floridensis]
MAKITKTIDLKQLAKKVPIVLISVGISWLILYLLRDMLRSSFLSPIETKKIVAEKEIVGTNSKVAALKRSGGRKNEETKKSRNNDMNDREDVEVIGAGSKGNLSGDAKEGSARNKHMSSVALSASDCASQKEYCALRQFLSEKQDRAVYIYVHVAENEICGKWKEGNFYDARDELIEKMKNKHLLVDVL